MIILCVELVQFNPPFHDLFSVILTVDVTYNGNDLNMVQVVSPLLERLIADKESRGELVSSFECFGISIESEKPFK